MEKTLIGDDNWTKQEVAALPDPWLSGSDRQLAITEDQMQWEAAAIH